MLMLTPKLLSSSSGNPLLLIRKESTGKSPLFVPSPSMSLSVIPETNLNRSREYIWIINPDLLN